MTKTAEIALLDSTIASFGTDSYIGPWLAEYREQIISDMKSDFSIAAPMPRKAQEISAKVLLDAGNEAEAIVARAKAEAEKIREDAIADRARLADRMIEAANKIRYGRL